MRSLSLAFVSAVTMIGLASSAFAQQPGEGQPQPPRPTQGSQDPGRGPGPSGPGGQEGGPAQMMRNMPLLAALDADGNGIISADEIKNAASLLRKLDKDMNGKLTADEMRPAGGFGGPGGGGGGGGGGERSNVNIVERIMQGDKDKDGKISKDELPSFMQQAMERLDTNKDGFLDKAEMEKMAETFGRRSGGGEGGPGGGGGGGFGPPGGGGFGPPGAAGGRPPGENGGDQPQRPASE